MSFVSLSATVTVYKKKVRIIPRNAKTGLSIQAKTRVCKIDFLKEIVNARGINPDELLRKENSSNQNATFIGQERYDAS